MNSNLDGLNGKSRYQGTYSNTYSDGSIFNVEKKNGLAILALNAKFHDIPESWVNIATFASDEIYPDSDMYLFSIPVRSTGGVFQIMINSGSEYVQGRYSGGTISTLVIQDTLIWFTQ